MPAMLPPEAKAEKKLKNAPKIDPVDPGKDKTSNGIYSLQNLKGEVRAKQILQNHLFFGGKTVQIP